MAWSWLSAPNNAFAFSEIKKWDQISKTEKNVTTGKHGEYIYTSTTAFCWRFKQEQQPFSICQINLTFHETYLYITLNRGISRFYIKSVLKYYDFVVGIFYYNYCGRAFVLLENHMRIMGLSLSVIYHYKFYIIAWHLFEETCLVLPGRNKRSCDNVLSRLSTLSVSVRGVSLSKNTISEIQWKQITL